MVNQAMEYELTAQDHRKPRDVSLLCDYRVCRSCLSLINERINSVVSTIYNSVGKLRCLKYNAPALLVYPSKVKAKYKRSFD